MASIPSFDDFSTSFSDIGGAASDLFSAAGDSLSADSYRKAAAISGNNAKLEEQSTAIKEAAINRQNYKVIGGQQNDVASAGFAAGGSSLDLLRDSIQQGAMTKAVAGLQGQINENGFLSQQTAELGEAQTADAAASGDIFGAIFKTIGAVAPFVSMLPL